ncbi:MAG: N-acetylmuramoyl-L-alanine amidase [Oscillospiraceae bacterium]
MLVIDAGHGGADGGAVAPDGMLESTVNLAVAQKTEALCHLFGIRCVMTRSGEELDYPEEAASIHQKKVWDQKTRVALINGTENAVLLSIHQNIFPDPRPSGSQVLYAATAGSQEFGELTHGNLVSLLDPENRRVAAPISKDIFLMRSVNCPAILVECGFLSNAAESAKLVDDSYRTKLAVILFASYIQYTDSLRDPGMELAA